MFFLASILQNAIIKTSTGFTLGKISFIAIDPTQGKIVGLIFSQGLLRKTNLVIVPKDIIAAGDGIITVANVDTPDPLEEIIRARDVFESHLNFFGIQSYTESGKYLGIVRDMLADKEGFFIHRFYIYDGKKERILPRDLAIGISNKKLVFKDEVLSKPQTTQEASTKLSPLPTPA